MATPSIKGSIIQAVIEDLERLRDEGRISDEQIETRLEAEEVALLGGKINAASWYPMASYTRMLQLLCDLEAGGDPGYFIERGRINARRLMDAGLYQQLSFIPRWRESVRADPAAEQAAIATYTRNLKLVITLATSIYNVGRWLVEPDEEHPRRVQIAVREASDYSEPMRLTAEGFLNECAREGDRGESQAMFRSERPRPDLILYRMNFDISSLTRA